jgi:small subunit ribosomal protein S6
LRPYETMLLLDAGLQDVEIDAALDRFGTLVTERGGEVSQLDRWGRRKLAYEMESRTEGYYAVFTYQLDPSRRADLEAALPFLEGLVRAKTVRRDVRTRTA